MAKYEIDFKQEVVKCYLKNGLCFTEKKYNVSKTAIYNWLRNYKGGTFMRKKTKQYSLKEKVEILNYYKEYGPVATEVKYNISRSVFWKWERIMIEALGIERRGRGIKPLKINDVNVDPDLLKEVQRLRLENAYLKKLRALTQKNKK